MINLINNENALISNTPKNPNYSTGNASEVSNSLNVSNAMPKERDCLKQPPQTIGKLKNVISKGSGIMLAGVLTLMIPALSACENKSTPEEHAHEEHDEHGHEEHDEHAHEEHNELAHEEHDEHGHEEHDEHGHEEHDEHAHEEHDEHAHEEHAHDESSHEEPVQSVNIKPNTNRFKDIDSLPDTIRNKTEIAISNYPLYLLSEAVTKGAPSAHLLLDDINAGHHASLSPGDMKTIKDSRYVVWFGPELESNLAKPLAKTPNAISLLSLEGFNRKPLRDVQGKPISGTSDPHIWLDPENAKAITRALGTIYSRANPKYKEVYQDNVKQFAQQMDNAVDKVTPSASELRPYWAYHDSFQYIEPTLKLDMVGTLTTDEHLPPKASQFIWLKQTRPQSIKCALIQSDSYESVLSKLKPIQSVVQPEDMNGSSDFISGWLAFANDINEAC